MIKELQYKGYATEPSDYECPDGQLATSLNLLNEDNQLKPLFQPAELFALPSGMAVKCLHTVSGNSRKYIVTAQNKLYYADVATVKSEQTKPVPASRMQQLITLIHDFGTDTVNDVKPVGNTLVILASTGVHYILWSDDNTYVFLGRKIPELNIQFGLNVELTCWPKDKEGTTTHAERAKTYGFVSGSEMTLPFWDNGWASVQPKDVASSYAPEWGDADAWTYSLKGVEGLPTMSGVISRWTNFALGQVNRFIAEHGMKKQKFVFPFLVRWAYELYDGSHVMHSEPVLMIPGSKYPFFAMDTDRGFRMKDVGNSNVDYWFEGRAYGFVGQLVAHILDDSAQLTELTTKWKDIVRGIDIYVSEPVYTYDQDGKVYGWTCMDDAGAWDEFYCHGKTGITGHTEYAQHAFEDIFKLWNAASGSSLGDRYYVAYDTSHLMPDYILTMPEKKSEDILRSIESPAFHKVASYKMDDYDLTTMVGGEQAVKIKEGALESLAARETLEDDYHSRDIIAASHAYAYNGRINLTSITRTLHAPLTPAAAWAKDSHAQRQWSVAVEYKADGERRVVASAPGVNGCSLPRYVFYSDRHATAAYLTYTEAGTTHRWRLPMTEHPHLEGAYWFAGLGADINVSEMSMAEEWPQESNNPIDEPNKIYTSEVNNPFYFPLLGINTVDTGTILAVCSAAKALSQGQFGQFPLYAFTSDGVWALELTNSGTFSAKQPITRDVCINPESITQLDDSVLFATDRGIMLISGSQTQCITDGIFSEAPFNVLELPGIDQLHASLGHAADACLPMQPFLAFLAGCQMVYDYVHQRIFVYNPTKENDTPKYTYAYVFSLKSKMWGMVFSDLASTINAYPEALAMTHDNKLVSFSETDEQVCKGLYITRPLKLEAADVQKTISTLIQRGHFQRGDVGTVLYGSRDLYSWHLVWSSKDHYLRGFRGTPYKYFRIAGLAALTDGKSVFGASVNFEPRHTNQLR